MLQVDGTLLRLDGGDAPEGGGDLAVVIRTPYGLEQRHALCPTRIAFERSLRQRRYDEVTKLEIQPSQASS